MSKTIESIIQYKVAGGDIIPIDGYHHIYNKKISGVYMLLKHNHIDGYSDVVYVGQSIDVRNRIRTHIKDKEFDKAIVFCLDKAGVDNRKEKTVWFNALENQMIALCKPIYNVFGVEKAPKKSAFENQKAIIDQFVDLSFEVDKLRKLIVDQ